MNRKNQSTSWEPVQGWYKSLVGKEGHYYHQAVVIPGVLRLLHLKSDSTLLDLACGEGILARHVPPKIPYVGIDIAPSFIKEAKKNDREATHTYFVGDVTKPLPIKQQFSHAAIILALQNIEHPLSVFKNVFQHLHPNGKLVIVLNHPCFRIPRQSSWEVDEEKKLQYRRIDRYLTPLQIPIQAHPSKGEQSSQTLSFHYPLSAYVKWLSEAGFVLEEMEEWISDKSSTGKAAKMENRSREEFPLFLTIGARKK